VWAVVDRTCRFREFPGEVPHRLRARATLEAREKPPAMLVEWNNFLAWAGEQPVWYVYAVSTRNFRDRS
jgi:hypothetical protein